MDMCRRLDKTTKVRSHLPNKRAAGPGMLGKWRGDEALLDRIFQEEPKSVGRFTGLQVGKSKSKRHPHPWKGKGLLDLPMRVVILRAIDS